MRRQPCDNRYASCLRAHGLCSAYDLKRRLTFPPTAAPTTRPPFSTLRRGITAPSNHLDNEGRAQPASLRPTWTSGHSAPFLCPVPQRPILIRSTWSVLLPSVRLSSSGHFLHSLQGHIEKEQAPYDTYTPPKSVAAVMGFPPLHPPKGPV